MTDDELPTLDIRISPAQSGSYAVKMTIGAREFPTGTIGPQILAHGGVGPAGTGTQLFAALVADVALRSAWDQAGALHPRRRVRLRIDDTAPELHTLPWETLYDPSPAATARWLAADCDTPFSRQVACPWAPLGPALAPLRVLTAVAAPTGLDAYGLAPIDRDRERTLLAEALAAAPPGLVQHTALTGPCTLAALAAELERGYHVLHLIAHGAVTAGHTASVMFLEQADGAVERVDVARFARAIDSLGRSLRLVVLMSCNTASRSPKDPDFGFAPALLAAGVPAVLAMQDLMPMPTAAAFTRAFYAELWQSGEIDRAANRARRVVVSERLPGNAVPVLYATNLGLRLWAPEPAARPTPDPAPPRVQPAPAAPEVAPVRHDPPRSRILPLLLAVGAGGLAVVIALLLIPPPDEPTRPVVDAPQATRTVVDATQTGAADGDAPAAAASTSSDDRSGTSGADSSTTASVGLCPNAVQAYVARSFKDNPRGREYVELEITVDHGGELSISPGDAIDEHERERIVVDPDRLVRLGGDELPCSLQLKWVP
jgi:hypothetical protein